MAVIEELIPGRDGEVRLVKLRTATGLLLRPIQRVYPLEICDEVPPKLRQPSEETVQETTAEATGPLDQEVKGVGVQTRSGRRIQLPSRFYL